MRVIAKSLYPMPLLDLDIISQGNQEEYQAIQVMIKLIEIAEKEYSAIPNERYNPKNRNDNNIGMVLVQTELIFKNSKDAKEFAFGIQGRL